MREISINSKEEMKIYMNPQRQRVLKLLKINGQAMTPKQLSIEMGISPSAVTSHIKQLESIGLVELDHTEKINGIQAKYYKKADVNVSLRTNNNKELFDEQEVFLNAKMTENWQGFMNYFAGLDEEQDFEGAGNMITGIAFLNQEDARQLNKMIQKFLSEHKVKNPDTKPWNTTFIFFPEE